MNNNIAGKSILFITQSFYEYDIKIRDTLLSLGAKSVYMKNSKYFAGDIRNGFSLHTVEAWIRNPNAERRWLLSFKKEIKDLHFDTLFVLGDLYFPKQLLFWLRRINPGIRMVLFLWDTLKMHLSGYTSLLPLFDKVYSFDRGDAAKFKFEYYPDFYIEKQRASHDKLYYDLSVIMTIRAENTCFRGQIVEKLWHECKSKGLNAYFYIRSSYEKRKIVMWYRNHIHMDRFKKAIECCKKVGVLHQEDLPLDDYYSVIASSKAILDVQYHERQGLTMNVINAIGNGIKLITTNRRIVEEPFYDPAMIYVIDEENPVLDKSFFDVPSKSVDISYLRIDNWLMHILGENDGVKITN